ncbi:MAG TPA: NAD(P)H-dependent oxidoreductase [Lacipirellulaceae bacterium]|jgi:NAD(P)H-dependent FMN reductase
MTQPRILAFAGSARRDSFNKKLVAIAAGGAKQAGADVTLIDLADYELPLFNQDLEAEKGLPEKAIALKKLFIEHQGLLVSCPEYNSSITPLLKNTIDWVSRQAPGEGGLAAYKGKVATLISASPGALGGIRGLVTVRSILGNIGVVVLPAQIAVPTAHQAIGENGRLKDEKMQASIEGLGRGLAEFLRKTTAP